MLKYTDSGIRRLIGRGKLKATKLGHDWLIQKRDLIGIVKDTRGGRRK
jgi:hypothetical protein